MFFASITSTCNPVEQVVNAEYCPICDQYASRHFMEAPDRFHGKQQSYRLVRCSSCSVVWLQNPPRPEEMDNHYGPDYDRVVAAAGEKSPERRWSPRRETLARYKSSGTILDIGCSAGSFLESLKKPAWNLYGIEISEAMARKARARTGAQVFVGDVLDAPFCPQTFDAITCFHVFEHLYEPRKVLARIAQWLKPGGVFYTLMPNIDSAGVRVFQSYWAGLELPRHLYHFSPVSLRKLATSVGLQETWLTTQREVLFEQSSRYIVDDVLRKFGVSREPLAKAAEPGIPFKIVRKMYRLSIQPVLLSLSSLAGDGETIHAVFEKESSGEVG